MRENRTSGSVQGAPGNGRSYCERPFKERNMRAIYVLIILLLASSVSHAQESFKSQEEFSKWLMFYYQNPEPDRIPDAVRYMSKSGVLDNKNAYSPIFGFLAGVIKENPNKAKIWAQELKAIKPNHYGVVILGIWYAKLPQSKKVVYEILDSNESLNKQFAYLRKGDPMEITEIPLEQGSWVLDALWGQFSATGKKYPVARIAETLPWIDIKGDTNRLLIGGAANWSVISNAVQHERVYSILSEMATETPNNTYLVKVINDAKMEREKRSNNQVNKDASH